MSDYDEPEPMVDAVNAVARALRDLGNGNAATPMGAIEAFSIVFKEGCEAISYALDGIAQSIDAMNRTDDIRRRLEMLERRSNQESES